VCDLRQKLVWNFGLAIIPRPDRRGCGNFPWPAHSPVPTRSSSPRPEGEPPRREVWWWLSAGINWAWAKSSECRLLNETASRWA